jgi:predicted dehydrogenase
MHHTPLTRRTFLKTTVTAAASVALSAHSWGQVQGANGDIRVAIVGLGGAKGRGRLHVKGYREVKGARIVALCDVDTAFLDQVVASLGEDGRAVQKFTDLRLLLERPDIDAISIATPNHQHVMQAIWGCQAGKDVYVEKPVSHTLWEGQQLVAAVAKYKRVVQVGTQSRSSQATAEAVAWVRGGSIGRITSVRGLCYNRRDSIGKTSGPQPVPATVDYDLWLGPAPKAPPRRKNFHYDWHWFWDTGNGDMGNQACHQMDIARWFLGEPALAPHVWSVGGRLGHDDDGETPNTLVTIHDYATAPLIFEVRGLPASSGAVKMDQMRGSSVGVIVTCEGGSVAVSKELGARGYDRDGKEVRQFKGSGDHFANFIDVVRSRKTADLRGPIQEGHVSSGLSHASNISYQLGRAMSPDEIHEKIRGNALLAEAVGRMNEHLAANGVNLGKTPVTLGVPLQVDPVHERFIDNEQANALLTREYRKPFVVPRLA